MTRTGSLQLLGGIAVGLAVALAVTACSGGAPLGEASGSTGSVSPSGASDTSPDASQTGGSEDRWDPRDWQPTVTIAAPSFTEDEKLQFRAQWLAQLAESSDLEDPPQVALVRWVEGSADSRLTLTQCMVEAGFDAKPDPSGGAGVWYPDGVPAAQDAALAMATYVCDAKYTMDPIYLQEWTDDQLGLIYDYWDQFYIPCLQAHGVSVNTDSEPSREAYIAAFFTDDRYDWWPMSALMQMPASKQASLNEACAQYPPDDVFYGS